MRASLVAGVVLVVSLGALPAHADAPPYLSITTAKTVTTQTVANFLVPFTENSPRIHVVCYKKLRATAGCRVTFTSDRLSGTVRAHVRRSRGEGLVWLQRLRVRAASRSVPSTRSGTSRG